MEPNRFGVCVCRKAEDRLITLKEKNSVNNMEIDWRRDYYTARGGVHAHTN